MTVSSNSRTEFTEKKSVFIGQTFFVRTAEEAESEISKVRNENPQATHVCFAYSLQNGAVQRFSDDGEPSGTAGMPILHVINTNGLSETLVTVTRYFGGILLGAGGLVRAYTKSAADTVMLSGKTEMADFVSFNLSYGYDLHGKIERDIPHDCIKDRVFGTDVCLSCELPEDEFSVLKDRLISLHHRYISIVETDRTCKRRSDAGVLF